MPESTRSQGQKSTQAWEAATPDWTAQQCLSFLESIGELLATWRRRPNDQLEITAGALGNLGVAIEENAHCLRRHFEESVFYGSTEKGGDQ